MKNISKALCILTILSASVVYADCPPVSDIYVQDDHFIASGLGGIWKDQYPTGGISLSRSIFIVSLANPVAGSPKIASNFVCGYGDQGTGKMFSLNAPSPDQKYQIEPGGYWKDPSPIFPQYVCEPIIGNVTECPFSQVLSY
ncbi:MAG: hypothetical protein K0R14_1710 [Burkholderiales bacterium]|jgi:hypothetical protein|nr:hypothetical protein [Burkholderiales bacterium]